MPTPLQGLTNHCKWVRMYQLLDVKKYFIGLTNTLLYAWDSNTVYIMLFIYLALSVADLAYVIVHRLTSICWNMPCFQRAISNWIEYPAKLNEKYIFQVLKVYTYIKIYEIQLPVLLFHFDLHQLLHQKMSFLQLLRTPFNNIWRKICITNFPLLRDSPKSPSPP